MADRVAEWAQKGRLCVWRYADPSRAWRGWHLTADPLGCRSIKSLLDRMHAGGQCHRTLKLEPVTDAILRVPNYGHKVVGHFDKLRIEYRPECEELLMVPAGERLTMTVGDKRLRVLSAAFATMETGGSDFGIATSDDRKAESWMFWRMIGAVYNLGKRS